jgi:hypothetical protein
MGISDTAWDTTLTNVHGQHMRSATGRGDWRVRAGTYLPERHSKSCRVFTTVARPSNAFGRPIDCARARRASRARYDRSDSGNSANTR